MANINFSPTLEQFVDRLLVEKNLVSLSPEVLEQMKKDLLEKAEGRLKATIFSNIPESQLAEFNQLMEGGDEEKLQVFIREQIPNLEEIMAQSLLDFRNTYLG